MAKMGIKVRGLDSNNVEVVDPKKPVSLTPAEFIVFDENEFVLTTANLLESLIKIILFYLF